MTIDYNSEQARLQAFKPEESGKFWKPQAGQYKVKALTELEEADPYVEEGKEPKPQAKIDLLLGDDEKIIWTIAKGKSPASAYGQLVNLASSNGNKLKDLQFLIVVTNDGKRNSYTIVTTQ